MLLSVLFSLLRFGAASYRNIAFNIMTPTVDERAAELFTSTFGSSLYFFNNALSFYASILSDKAYRNAFYERIRLLYRHCVAQLVQRNLWQL